MNISRKLMIGLVAASAMMPVALMPHVAYAQQYNAAYASPNISLFNVEEVKKLAPGIDLDFTLYGTPGGIATLRIAGASRNLNLIEVEAGQYEGTYTISSRDRIAARSAVTANLRLGSQVTTLVLNESLQIGVGNHRQVRTAPGPQPTIGRFTVEPSPDLSRGNDLRFTVFGTPGGELDLVIDGVRGKILVPEVNRGEYTTTYYIRPRDRINPNSVVTASLTVGGRVVSMNLGKSLQTVVAPAPVAPICRDCGTVEAVNVVEVKGQGSYLGTIGGGVVGALLGSQIGGGNGRTAAQVAGAVGGAYAGNAIEGNARSANHIEIVVRLQNGAAQTISFAADPGLRVGDKVRVNNGVISRD